MRNHLLTGLNLGFDTTHRARFPILGKHGLDLSTQWGTHPEAYLGLAVPNVLDCFPKLYWRSTDGLPDAQLLHLHGSCVPCAQRLNHGTGSRER